MKIKFIEDYSGKYGEAPAGRIDHIINSAGKELILEGIAIEVNDDDTEKIEHFSKDNPVRKKKEENTSIIETLDNYFQKINDEFGTLQDEGGTEERTVIEDESKFTHHPSRVTWWDKIKSLCQRLAILMGRM